MGASYPHIISTFFKMLFILLLCSLVLTAQAITIPTPATPPIDPLGCRSTSGEGFFALPLHQSLLQFKRAVGLSECDFEGTLTTSPYQSGVECICKYGYVGSRCQFLIMPVVLVGIHVKQHTIPPSYVPYGSHIGLVSTTRPFGGGSSGNGAKRYRYKFGYHDVDRDEHVILPRNVMAFAPHRVTAPSDDAVETSRLSDNKHYYPSTSPDSTLIQVKVPYQTDLPSNTHCLTLFAYELDDEHINTDTEPDVINYEPLLSFTAVSNTALNEFIPDPSQQYPECLPPKQWIGDDECGCLPEQFGDLCQFKRISNKSPHIPYVNSPASQVLHTNSDFVYLDQTVILKFETSPEYNTNPTSAAITINSPQRSIPITLTNTSPNQYTISFRFDQVFNNSLVAYGETLFQRITFELVDDRDENNITTFVQDYIISHTCYNIPLECNPVGTQSCSLPYEHNPVCTCKPNWYGPNCYWTTTFTRLDTPSITQSYTPFPTHSTTGNNVITAGTPLLIGIHDNMKNSTFQHIPTPPHNFPTTQLSPTITFTYHYPGDSDPNISVLSRLVDYGNVDTSYYLVRMPQINLEDQTIDIFFSASFDISFNTLHSISTTIDFTIESVCETTTSSYTGNTDGLAGCGHMNLVCKSGYFGLDCSQYLGTIAPLQDDIPFYSGASVNWSGSAVGGDVTQSYRIALHQLSQPGHELRVPLPGSRRLDRQDNFSIPDDTPQLSIPFPERNAPFLLFMTMMRTNVPVLDIFIDLLNFASCDEMVRIYNSPPPSVTVLNPPCYLPNTERCHLLGLFSTTAKPCLCKVPPASMVQQYTGKHCQTSVSAGLGSKIPQIQLSTPSNMYSQPITIQSYPFGAPITINTSSSTPKINYSDGHSQIILFPSGIITFKTTNERGVCNNHEFDTITQTCRCKYPFFGKNCAQHLSMISPTRPVGYIGPYESGETIEAVVATLYPDVQIDPVFFTYDRVLVGINSTKPFESYLGVYHFTPPQPMTSPTLFNYPIPSLQYHATIEFKFDTNPPIIIDIIGECSKVYTKFGQYCLPGLQCDSTQQTFETACSSTICQPGYYSRPGKDFQPCSRYMAWEHNQANNAIHLRSNINIEFTCPLDIPQSSVLVYYQIGSFAETFVRATSTSYNDKCRAVLPTFHDLDKPTMSLRFVEEYINPLTNTLTEYTVMSLSGIRYYNSATLCESSEYIGDLSPLTQQKCNSANTQSCSFSPTKNFITPIWCECKPGFYGKFCDFKITHDFNKQTSQMVNGMYQINFAIEISPTPSDPFLFDTTVAIMLFGKSYTISTSNTSNITLRLHMIRSYTVNFQTIVPEDSPSWGRAEAVVHVNTGGPACTSACVNPHTCVGTTCLCRDSNYGPLCSFTMPQPVSLGTVLDTFPTHISDVIAPDSTSALLLNHEATFPPLPEHGEGDEFRIFRVVGFGEMEQIGMWRRDESTSFIITKEQQLYYLSSRLGSIEDGAIPIPINWSWNSQSYDSCEWFARVHVANNGSNDHTLACIPQNSAVCNLYAQTAAEVCTCKQRYTDVTAGTDIITFGQYCQYKISIPLGPYYIGQRVPITFEVAGGVEYGNLPNVSIQMHYRTGKDTPPTTSTLFTEFNTVTWPTIEVSEHITVKVVTMEINDPGVDTGIQPLYLEPSEINKLLHFTWSIQDLDSETYLVESKLENEFRIVEPCYWTLISQSSVVCSTKHSIVDGVYDYTAVSSCMDQDTHEIKCQCKPGYFSDECRLELEVATPPDANNRYHSSQRVRIDYAWYTEPNDYHQYSIPNLTMSVGDRNVQLVDKKQRDSYYIGYDYVFGNQERFKYTKDASVRLDSLSFALTSSTTTYRHSRGVKIVNPYHQFYDQTIVQPLNHDVYAVKSNYGVTCPGNQVIGTGCFCQNGLFGPDCSWKFEWTVSIPPFNSLFRFLGVTSDAELLYTITKIPSPHVLTTKTHNIPQKYHFEYRVDCSKGTKSGICYTGGIIPPGSKPNSLKFDLPVSTMANIEIFLISDDDDDALSEYFVLRTVFFPPNSPPCHSSTSYQPDVSRVVLSDPLCFCKPGWTGTDCTTRYIISSFDLNPIQDVSDPMIYKVTFSTNFYIYDFKNSISRITLTAIPLVFTLTQPHEHVLDYDPVKNTISYNGILHDFVPFETKYALRIESIPRFSTAMLGLQPRAQISLFPTTDNTDYTNSSNISLHDQINILSTELSYQHINSIQPYTTPSSPSFKALQEADQDTPPIKIHELFTAVLSRHGCDITDINCVAKYTLASTSHTQPVTNFIPFSSTHHTTEPIMVIPHASKVTITIPRFTNLDPGTDIKIQLKYVPILVSQPSSTPLTVLTRTIKAPEYAYSPQASKPTVVSFSIPSTFVADRVFFSLSYSTQIEPNHFVTPLFTILPACYRPPTVANQHNNRDAWTDICMTNGTCSSTTQQCVCNDGFSGTTCTDVVIKCPQCHIDNILSCELDDECVCKPEWTGHGCNIPAKCSKENEKKCFNGGSLAPSPPHKKCSDSCICTNMWIGQSCNTCSLQCQNNGIRYADCNRCGCNAGYTGQYCECRSAQGRIRINGYNEILVKHAQLVKINNNGNIHQGELNQHIIARAAIHEFVTNILSDLLTIEPSSLHTQLTPLPAIGSTSDDGSLLSTEISITISFGCPQANSELTSMEATQRWSQMSQGLLNNQDIRNLFIFPTMKPEIDIEPIKDTDNTLPEDGDALPNNNSFKHNILLTIYSILVIIIAQFV